MNVRDRAGDGGGGGVWFLGNAPQWPEAVVEFVIQSSWQLLLESMPNMWIGAWYPFLRGSEELATQSARTTHAKNKFDRV